jgi:uncharacterized protein YbjT (DUF2867 family)
MKILAVGASGHIAGLVIPALVQHGAIVRGLVRRPAQVDIAKERGAAEVAVGDLLDPASLDAAMKGVSYRSRVRTRRNRPGKERRRGGDPRRC